MSWFFFFNDTATTEIYTLSLHDALPICEHHPPQVRAHAGGDVRGGAPLAPGRGGAADGADRAADRDRKSTRLNSSHANISYAVFCLKKKKALLSRVVGLPFN